MAPIPKAYIEKCKQNYEHFIICWTITNDKKWKDMFRPEYKEELEKEETQKEINELYIFWFTHGIQAIRREWEKYQLEKNQRLKNEQESVKANDLL